MLLTRPLPPQFLLPAWSAHQLAQLVQRAYSIDRKAPVRYTGKPAPALHRRLDLSYQKLQDDLSNVEERDENKNLETCEGIVQGGTRGNNAQLDEAGHKLSEGAGKHEVAFRPNIERRREAVRRLQIQERKHIQREKGESERSTVSARGKSLESWAPVTLSKPGSLPPQPPMREKMKKKRATEPTPRDEKQMTVVQQPSALSLFDELFPEERHTKTPEQRLVEHRLDKLPAFNWSPEINIDDYDEEHTHSEPEQDPFHQIPQRRPWNSATQYTPVSSPPLARPSGEQDQALSGRESILVLSACSKTLEESDFFRLSPKGQHIEGWKSGLLKVIPSRDNKTLESLGSYFLLFSSNATARAYLDQTMRLHTLSRLYRREKEARFPLPPGYLKEGESMEDLLKGFSLIPGFVKLSLRMLNRPYSPRLKQLITEGGPVALARKEANTENLVLFTTDQSHITHADVRDVLAQDGRRRNMHWHLAADRHQSIIKFQGNGRREAEDFVRKGYFSGSAVRTYNGPSQFIISLKDSTEARRFAREWHRRPLPIQKGARAEDEPPPIVNAEILW